MRCRTKLVLILVAAGGYLATPALAQRSEVFVPLFVYRTGPYALQGIPIANAFIDYFTLINERDGGVNGIRLNWEECETQYDTGKGVECYERFKGKGATLVNPYTTGLVYQLVPRASVDKIPVLSMGYGMAAAADGRWFPWIFNLPTSYWSQASAMIRYIGLREHGLEKLKGKKIAHIYLNNAYGKEANPTFETLARQFGYRLTLLPVNLPGEDQKSVWRQVKRLNPDWILLSGWGVMSKVAIAEAAAVNYPMDHMIGNWWSASEGDVVSAGAAARGYIGATFHGAGAGFKVHQELFKYVYDRGKGSGKREAVGEVLYNRGLVNAMLSVEAIRTAMAKVNGTRITGEHVRWGLEHLDLTNARLEELGMNGFMHPIRITCADHEGSGPVMFQQWDGKTWKIVSDWIPIMREVVRPKLEAAAFEEGKRLAATMRDC